MVDETLPTSPKGGGAIPTLGGIEAPRALRCILGGIAVAGISAFFALRAPDANAWAAAFLVAALALDGLGRIAEERVARRSTAARRLAEMPSAVLRLAEGAGLGGALFGLGLLLRPSAFQVLATALAGLVAMAGSARLATAMIVARRREPEDGADLTGV